MALSRLALMVFLEQVVAVSVVVVSIFFFLNRRMR